MMWWPNYSYNNISPETWLLPFQNMTLIRRSGIYLVKNIERKYEVVKKTYQLKHTFNDFVRKFRVRNKSKIPYDVSSVDLASVDWFEMNSFLSTKFPFRLIFTALSTISMDSSFLPWAHSHLGDSSINLW